MKNAAIKTILFLVTSILITQQIFASTGADGEDLQHLDVLKTCNSEEQIKTAKIILTQISHFHWWNVKDLYAHIHTNFVELNAAHVFVASLTPEEKRSQLPFGKGIISKENYLKYLATIAYTNEASNYTINVKRLECAGDDTVFVTTIFNTLSVLRDEFGYIRKQVPIYNLNIRFVYQVKDNLVYKTIVDLDDDIYLELLKSLPEKFNQAPVLPKDETTRVTFDELYNRFKAEAGVTN